jgi:conjugal transfer mating pair stabilization protein TraG
MSSEQLAEFKQFGDRVSRDASFMSMIANDSREAHEMAARLASTHARSERAEASLADRTAFAERVSAAHEKGEAISIDIAQDPHNLEMFMRYAEHYGGNSAAAHTLMESELARQSLRPNRVFSDGTALPASFGDIRDQHVHQRGDAALTPDIAGLHQSNREQTSRFGNAKPSQGTAPMVSPIREEVRTHGDQIRIGCRIEPCTTSTPRLRSSRPMTERLHRRNRCWCSQASRSVRTPERHSTTQRM